MQSIKLFKLLILLLSCFHFSSNACNCCSGAQPIIKVAIMPVLSSSPAFIAKIKGYYQAEGIKVHFEFKESAQAVAEAVASNKADIGITGITSALLNLMQANPMKIIAGQYREVKGHPGSVFITNNNAYEKGLTDINQLRGGERFGMTTIGSTFHHWFAKTVNKLNFNLADFQLVPLTSVKQMHNSLVNNEVDIIITSALAADNLIQQHQAHIIGAVADYSPGQLGVVFTLATSLTENKKAIGQFINAYKKGCADYNRIMIEQKDETAFSMLLTKLNDYLEPKLQSTMHAQKSIKVISADGSYNKEELIDTINWYQQSGLVNQPVDIDTLFYSDR